MSGTTASEPRPYEVIGAPRSGLQLAVAVGRSVVEGARGRRSFGTVERFCLFVGYPRSGHSLIGSLLNAHPHMVVAHELDVLRYVRLGLRRDQLYAMLIRRDREFASVGRQWSGYEYVVPGQHQGRADPLRVIGDKRGGTTSAWLERQPELLERLRAVVGVPLAVVHVTRHPLDNIATIATRNNLTVDKATERYRRFGVAADAARRRLAADELLDMRYEDFAADPVAELARLCRFLHVECTEGYLSACAGIVQPASVSRGRVEWTAAQRRAVQELIASRPVLAGYDVGE